MTTRLTFACELEPEALEGLFSGPAVAEHLLALGATVSMGLLDLSPRRAAVVRRLNDAGVPLVAWLLLPKEEGYWFHAGNVARAAACYEAFVAWTAEQGLHWAGVGFDVEPDYAEMELLFSGGFGRLLPRILGRLWNGGAVRRAEAAYAALAGRARADGYRVEVYQFPFIADERRADSSLLRRAFQIINVPADLEVWMLYTSFLPGFGPGLVWSYARDEKALAPSLKRGIGVGSTGGGVELPGGPPPLSWEQLSRDLRLAHRWSDEIFVFSLEGCVQHGYLARLQDLDWQAPLEPPLEQADRVDAVRRLGQGCLWAGSRPLLIAAVAAAATWLAFRLKRQAALCEEGS